MGETPLALASPFGRRPHWLGYTNQVRLRGLMKIKGLKPAQAGFACVAATSSRLVQDMG